MNQPPDGSWLLTEQHADVESADANDMNIGQRANTEKAQMKGTPWGDLQ